ncbi:MAG: iron-sulfur cluster assembly scaffold protein [Promethearchaeota archaeon]
MKSTQYSKKVLDHFRNPRNVGTLEGDDVAVGRVGNPVCGDLMYIYIKVKDGKIVDIRFKTFGCGSAVATSSMITELAKGLTLEDAMKITRQDVADELEGLPPIKMHCSNLAADALHEAIKNYLSGKGIKVLDEVPARISCDAGDIRKITGISEFIGRGVHVGFDINDALKDKRVLIIEYGDESIKAALELTEITGRVILITPLKKLSIEGDLAMKLKRSDVKVLLESEVVAVLGTSDVEKVRIHDLNDDEDYELFVDAVLIPK